MSTQDRDRRLSKLNAIAKRLSEIRGNEPVLLSLLDETKLDMMILALGIGEVEMR